MRSKWKIPFIHKDVLKKIIKRKRIKMLKTRSRSTMITHHLLGKTCVIYDGRGYKAISITTGMVGHKLGEFVSTKKRAVYIHKKKGAKN